MKRGLPALARRRSSPADEGGFTLVEVLAAVFIFAVISTATFTIIISALKTVDQNNERVLSANVARSQIEYLRLQGAVNIPPGLSTVAPPGTRPDFAVETTAEWVGLGQTASACDAASPGQAYLRVRVAVTSPEVEGASVVDTIITPESTPSEPGTAAAAIAVADHHGDPVSGVRVTALDTTHPENSFTYVTGADGCLFVPGLTAPGMLTLTISKDGYVASTATGTQASVQLDQDSLAKPTFLYAPAGGIDFVGALTDFPLAAGTPVTWVVNETGAVVRTGAVGTPVSGQWPTTSGFTAWAGACPDADPEVYESSRQSFDFVAGDRAVSALSVRPVRLRGLPPATPVTARHVGGGCSNAPFPVGVSDDKGVLRLSLPNGDWEFTADTGTETETVGLAFPLGPPAEGVEEPITVVQFTLGGPEPSPSGSPSPSPSPTP